jgi:DNA-binding GntR family transcriptional regulator
MTERVQPAGDGVPARQSAEYVYRRVRAAILGGELTPGATMSQVALAGELGVSRTPLREALRMLQAEALIEARMNRQVRVASVSADDLEELFAVRITLEVQAVRLSVGRMPSGHLARLEGAIAEMTHFAEQRDMRGWQVAHAMYHRLLVERAGDRFAAVIAQIYDQSERYRALYLGAGPRPWATADHREILDAVKATDADRAGALLARHVSRIAFEVAELIEPGRTLTTLRRVLADAGAAAPPRAGGRSPEQAR